MTSVAHDYQYSVKVQSRFDLLASDELNAEDPTLLLQKLQNRQKQHVKADAPKDAAPTPKAATSEKHADKSAERSAEDFSGPRRGQPRGGRGGGRPVPAGDDDAQVAPKGESWEGRGRGGRGRSGFTRSRPQRFDRHSGSDKTGVKPTMKKDGYGTGNWGTIEDELDVTMPTEPIAETVEKEEEAPAPEEPVEEEPKKLTLKEYKEQQKALKIKVELSKKGGRKANDGKDVFNNMVSINQSKPTEAVVDVLADSDKKNEEKKPVFFDFGHDQTHQRRERPPFSGGRGGRGGEHNTDQEQPSMPAGGRGRGRGSFNPERGGGRGGRGAFNPDRAEGGRGAFNADRSEGGRGGERRSFNPERGRGGARGTGERGAERGGSRGGRGRGRGGSFDGAPSDRPSFRGGRGAPRGAGGFRGGRGGFEGPTSSRVPTAPVMDSEMDFPALK